MAARLLVRAALWCWALAALAAGRLGWLEGAHGPVLAALALALATFALSCSLRFPALRAWWDGLDARRVALFHTSRLAGLFLLWSHHRGELPTSFALPAALADLLIAVLALPVALAPVDAELRRRALVIWNMFGLASLLLTLAHLARLPEPAPALTSLPLSLGPTLLVPVLLVSHVLLLLRGRSDAETPPPSRRI